MVTDSSGGVLPGVTVTVTGTGLQQPLSAQTNPTGSYTFAKVPIGTYTVTFSLTGFKKAVRKDVLINTGFSAKIDMSLAIGSLEQEVTVSGATPTVDTKKTTTGGTFTGDIILNVPTARDPWQVLNLTPGISLSNVNVGGSASGQQPTLSYAGSSSSVQWNLEGGNITDMSSNSSPAYFNFDSFQEIQVVTGGGDVSVQSAGLFINLVTKSGSNVFKGSATETFENHSMQGQNVSQAMFNSNTTTTGGFGLSGAPLNRVGNYSGEIGGPVIKNRLWFWGGADYQDINAGVVNFFKSTPECAGPFTYAQLALVQKCLANDKTLIQDFNAKVNFQLNSANKFQFLTQTDYKLRNNRGANSTTAPEATTSQYSAGVGRFTNPTYQVTHTWLPSDKLVFTNQYTFLAGGFFLDNHDYTTCGSSTYLRANAGAAPVYVPDNTNVCQYNIQPLANRTTGLNTRSISAQTYQTNRPSYELKTDGTYFVSHLAGGDHALKFGVGWRKNPTLTYSHPNGGANVTMECVGNVIAGCPADGKTVVDPANNTGVGLVPFRAVLVRDSLVNYDWQTTFAYLQDSYTKKRMTINGGVRYDYQWSRFLGGCDHANEVAPLALQGQCQGAADPKQPFHNLSPRVSATYDLTGKGKTAVHASYSYYFASKQVLANNISNLTNTVSLTYGSNQNSGLCSTVANASCWNDANHDGFIQLNELLGTPTPSTSLYNTTTGVLSTVPPTIDPSLKLPRTREGIVGFDHQVVSNVHTTFDFIYRYNDRNQATYTLPLSGLSDRGAAIAQVVLANSQWVAATFADPNTGLTGTYYTCPVGSCGLVPAGVATSGNTVFTTNSQTYSTYKGVQIAISKRLSNKWQGSLSYTWNDFRNFTPVGSFSTSGTQLGNPTGIAFTNGFTNNTPRFTVKANGSVELPWGFIAGMNLLVQDGDVRTVSINGPGTVASALTNNPASTITYSTLTFEPAGTHHLPTKNLLDLNVGKTIKFGRQELRVTLDAFNVLNIGTTTSFSSGNSSLNGLNGTLNSFNSISGIVPPRVFRIDARFSF